MATPLDNLDRITREDGLLKAVARFLNRAEEGRFYLWGSYVLDAVAGLEPDGIALACREDPDRAARSIARATGRPLVDIRGRDGVYLLPHPKGKRAVLVGPLRSGSISGHLKGAAFTVDSMAVDLSMPGFSGLLDPFNGLGDLLKGRLRRTGEGSVRRDPARVLRSVWLCNRHGLRPDGGTLAELKGAAPGLMRLAPDRLWRLIARTMSDGGLSSKARLMRESGALAGLLPEVEALFEVPQNYYHHLGVWEHTLEMMDRLEDLLDHPESFFPAYGTRIKDHLRGPVEGNTDRRTLTAFAALVHDVGKAATMSVEPSGRIRFKWHQVVSARMAGEIAGRLGLGKRARSHLVGLAGQHMRLGFLLKDGETTEGRLETVRELGSRTIEVALISLADRMATRGEAATVRDEEIFRRLVSRVVQDYFWQADTAHLISGGDVLVHTGVEPGPGVGALLFGVRVAQREGVVSDRAQALEYIAPDFKGKMR